MTSTDLLNRVASSEIDRNSTRFLSFFESLRNVVHHIDLICATHETAIGGEQANGTCSENGDAIT